MNTRTRPSACAFPQYHSPGATAVATNENAKTVYPSAGGLPFSNAIRAGDFVLVSGQMAFLPDGSLSAGPIEQQTRLVMEAIKAILETAGCTMAAPRIGGPAGRSSGLSVGVSVVPESLRRRPDADPGYGPASAAR
ncbi:MAG: RidA family protein [Gemmatimonadota bacterium]